ncbi:MAG: transglycosylase domain-containing protein, partial [Emcibacter sp.]|nr:transglycosylase domain-containing protein [Emcibacter sp.]
MNVRRFPGYRFFLYAGGTIGLLMVVTYAALTGWYGWYAAQYPLNLDRWDDRGALILDRDGAYLHMFAAEDGIFRLKADMSSVDSRYIDVLVAFEDKRFYDHGGVDYLALFRAVAQAV